MILTYNKIPIFLLDSTNSKILGLSEALVSNKAANLFRESGASLSGATNSNSAINLVVMAESQRNIPLDGLVTTMQNYGSVTTPLLLGAINQMAAVLKVTKSDIEEMLLRAEDEYATVLGKLAPKSKYPIQQDIFLATYANKINALFFAQATNAHTVKMETCTSEVIIALPPLNDVLNNSPDTPYTLPDLNHLHEVPVELKTFFWKRYATSLGIPPTHVVGSKENSMVPILANEQKLFDQLRSLYIDCVKAEFRVDPGTENFELHRPKSFMTLIHNLIYIALRHNWMHTIAIPSYAHLDALIDEDDDEGYDEQDETEVDVKEKLMNVTNYAFDVSEEDKDAKLQQLRILFGKADVQSLINGYENTIKFIEFIDNKKPSINNYITAFIKLIRWGDVKINRLILESYDKFYLDLEYFIQNEDKTMRPKKLSPINGKTLLPTNATYLRINPPPTVMASLGMENTLAGIVPGLFVDRLYTTIDNNEPINDPMYLDVFKIWETYVSNKTEDYVIGIAYENGIFYYEEDNVATLCKGFGNPLFKKDYMNEYNFSLDGNKVSYEVPDTYLEDFMAVDIADKRGMLNSVRIIEMFKLNAITSAPVEFRDWLMRWATIYKLAVAEGISTLDLCSLLNIINKHKDRILNVVATADNGLNGSNAFNDFPIDGANSDDLILGDLNMAKLNYDDLFKNSTLKSAYAIRDSKGAIMCYMTADLKLYNKNSLVEVIANDRVIALSQIINTYLTKNLGEREALLWLLKEF